MFSTEELEEAMSMAKIEIMKTPNTMFLSTVMCSLETVYDEDIPTAATNGTIIKYSPTFFMSLSHEERTFLIAHETLHVVYSHMLRRGERDPQKFNAAADYVINLELVNQGFKMPKMGLIDPIYAGLTTEEVYELLPEAPDNPLDGDLEECEGDSDGTETKHVQAAINSIIARSVQLADMREQGNGVPSSVRRMLQELQKPEVNWKVALLRFMDQLNKPEFSWRKRNRRHTDMYMPSTINKPSLDLITFAFDTSGSVNAKQFMQHISEVDSLFKTIKPKEIELLQFDHMLQSVDSVKSLNDLYKVEFTGHGGTEPEVAIQHFMGTKSKGLIIMTDGYFNTKNLSKPKQPVLWIIYDNDRWTAPYGKTIHISLRK